MRTAQKNPQLAKRSRSTASLSWSWLTAFAAFIGLALLVDTSLANSATYDEVTYLRVAARWSHGRSIRDFPNGLSPHFLEATTNPRSLVARSSWSSQLD